MENDFLRKTVIKTRFLNLKNQMNKEIRLLSRLDIKGPNLIKGEIEGLRVISDPEGIAIKYYDQGIDELIYIDTVAKVIWTKQSFGISLKKLVKKLFVPITVGGGIRSVDDAQKFLNARG